MLIEALLATRDFEITALVLCRKRICSHRAAIMEVCLDSKYVRGFWDSGHAQPHSLAGRRYFRGGGGGGGDVSRTIRMQFPLWDKRPRVMALACRFRIRLIHSKVGITLAREERTRQISRTQISAVPPGTRLHAGVPLKCGVCVRQDS